MVANGFEGVPWMVGGGAKHSANVGRVLAYAATSGAEGVVAPTDCKVSASAPTPDGYVHVGTGAVVVRNRYGSASSESYIARANQVSDLQVASTGSSARSDLVVVRIKDPQYGGQAPASVADGPYAFPEIIPGVPAGTTDAKQIAALLNQPVYAIARIDQPANNSTGAITAGMVKSLRKLAQPRSETRNYGGGTGLEAAAIFTVADTYGHGDLFDSAPLPNIQPMIDIPEWATHFDIVTQAVVQTTPGSQGAILTRLGDNQWGPLINWVDPIQFASAADIAHVVPPELRGTTQKATMRVRVDTGQFALIRWATIVFTVTFYERPL